jgi:hypothetical protein
MEVAETFQTSGMKRMPTKVYDDEDPLEMAKFKMARTEQWPGISRLEGAPLSLQGKVVLLEDVLSGNGSLHVVRVQGATAMSSLPFVVAMVQMHNGHEYELNIPLAYSNMRLVSCPVAGEAIVEPLLGKPLAPRGGSCNSLCTVPSSLAETKAVSLRLSSRYAGDGSETGVCYTSGTPTLGPDHVAAADVVPEP